MSVRELQSLAPWRWDRSKKPVGEASMRDFEEVWGRLEAAQAGGRGRLLKRRDQQRAASCVLWARARPACLYTSPPAPRPQVNKIIPCLAKDQVDVATAAAEAAAHVSGRRAGAARGTQRVSASVLAMHRTPELC